MSRFILSAFLMTAFVLTSPAAEAQMRDREAQRAAMDALAFMAGEWMGPGWRIMPDGERVENVHLVQVTPKANGLVFIIEGRGVRQGDMDARPGDGSFAVIGFDEISGDYVFHSYGFGERIEARAELVEPRVFRWTVEGDITMRFTVDITTPGIWQEMGEVRSTAEEAWQQTYAVTHYLVDAP